MDDNVNLVYAGNHTWLWPEGTYQISSTPVSKSRGGKREKRRRARLLGLETQGPTYINLVHRDTSHWPHEESTAASSGDIAMVDTQEYRYSVNVLNIDEPNSQMPDEAFIQQRHGGASEDEEIPSLQCEHVRPSRITCKDQRCLRISEHRSVCCFPAYHGPVHRCGVCDQALAYGEWVQCSSCQRAVHCRCCKPESVDYCPACQVRHVAAFENSCVPPFARAVAVFMAALTPERPAAVLREYFSP